MVSAWLRFVGITCPGYCSTPPELCFSKHARRHRAAGSMYQDVGQSTVRSKASIKACRGVGSTLGHACTAIADGPHCAQVAEWRSGNQLRGVPLTLLELEKK